MSNTDHTTVRILAIIPAYNEEASIVGLTEELNQDAPHIDYVVINDGSSDATQEVLQTHHINHLTLPCNLGLDGAFRTGILYAQAHGYDYVVQIDGDGQHMPAHIDTLIQAEKKTGADIVIGSRFVTQRRPFSARMLGSAFITAMLRLTCHVSIKDPTSGMRLYNKRAIETIAQHPELAPEPDSIALMIRSGSSVVETQVEMRERTAGKSYLSIKRSLSYMLRVGISILFVQWFRKKEY